MYGQGLDLGQLSLDIKEKIAGVSNFVVRSLNFVTPPENIVLAPLQIFNKID